ncbi:maleylpyruvate isomerase N-terminal domain-containing protein [Kribbella sp. NPDC051770]|uniref:maleylpyruvate isomerase N-terminal domain-containing protein n=1 Tax=Kribbella sp. NPDC051770 TaxID=3155413 RepID=UPI00343474F2
MGLTLTDFLARATADFLARAEAIPSAAFGNHTPCDVSVGEVMDHVVAGNIFAARLLAGASAAEATADLDTPPADRLAALHTTCAAQLAAFADADRGSVFHHPSRDIDYATFARFRLGELVIHGWDLTVGAGQGNGLDPLLAENLWTLVEPHLEEMQAMGTYGTSSDRRDRRGRRTMQRATEERDQRDRETGQLADGAERGQQDRVTGRLADGAERGQHDQETGELADEAERGSQRAGLGGELLEDRLLAAYGRACE